jgi:hypothetical protein
LNIRCVAHLYKRNIHQHKKRTMSWGNKLVIVFVAFAALMGILVYKAVNTKFELVTKDYYKDELRYQDKIDGAANASAAGNITLVQDGSTISLSLPSSLSNTLVEGEAWFYCKTKAVNDQRISIRTENGKYIFNLSNFAKDSYELKLQFTSGDKKYYYTELISIK